MEGLCSSPARPAGVGAATARTIVSCGGEVVLHDLSAQGRLDDLRQELGESACALTADLSDPASAGELWREALAWRGRIDALVNNAGIYEPASIEDDLDAWTAAWDRTLAICLVAPATLCREAVRTFREQEHGGTIVNLASRAAWRGEDSEYGHYAAAKAGGGDDQDDRPPARARRRDGVRRRPWIVNTPFNDPAVDRYGLDFFAQDTALGEVAESQDVANVVAFLASGLARHATGTTVDVNGASYVR